MKEIERKFLVPSFPCDELATLTPERLFQGYLSLSETSELRLRKRDDAFYLTRKQGSGLEREETEEPISEAVFSLLWPLTKGQRVEKRRYVFTIQQYRYELDIYEGKLTGLTVLEVEFESRDAARLFTPPHYCSQEVTEDKRFKNACLATLGKPD